MRQIMIGGLLGCLVGVMLAWQMTPLSVWVLWVYSSALPACSASTVPLQAECTYFYAPQVDATSVVPSTWHVAGIFTRQEACEAARRLVRGAAMRCTRSTRPPAR